MLKTFDECAAEWLLKYRAPSTEDLARVMERACSYGRSVPSVSLLERAYRELLSEGKVALVTEKIVPPPTAVEPEVLTAEAYRKIPAAEIARRYMLDRSFKAQVDTLISQGKI